MYIQQHICRQYLSGVIKNNYISLYQFDIQRHYIELEKRNVICCDFQTVATKTLRTFQRSPINKMCKLNQLGTFNVKLTASAHINANYKFEIALLAYEIKKDKMRETGDESALPSATRCCCLSRHQGLSPRLSSTASRPC